MRCKLAGPLVLAMVCIQLGAVSAAATEFETARRDTVLSWDDGENTIPPVVTGGELGTQVAVGFIAPAWADRLEAIRFYIETDAATAAFQVLVWRPDLADLPGALAGGQPQPAGYPGDSWLEVVLAPPIDIGDPAAFPGRRFFVGLEMLQSLNPAIGADISAPVDGMTWRRVESAWEPIAAADAMIRAVVGDTDTMSASNSWSAIRTLYR